MTRAATITALVLVTLVVLLISPQWAFWFGLAWVPTVALRG